MTMPRPERLLKPMARGREAAFADEEEELQNQTGAGPEQEGEGAYSREMLRRIKEAEKEAATGLEEARQTEIEWDAMTPASQPELVYAKRVESPRVSAMQKMRKQLLGRIGALAVGVSSLVSAQVGLVAAAESRFSKDLQEEVDPKIKATVEGLEGAARGLVSLEEEYAPGVVAHVRRTLRGAKGRFPEVTQLSPGFESLPEASPEQYLQFSQEADELLRRTIAEGNVPLGEDAWSWMEDTIDPLASQFEARHGVSINVHEGPVNTNFQQMLRNYIQETVEADPDRASQVADALEPGDGYRLAVQRHDGRVAAERLYDYLTDGDTLIHVLSEGPEHLRWVLPYVNPTDQAEMLDILRDRESDARHLAQERQDPALKQEASRLRAAIQIIESVRR